MGCLSDPSLGPGPQSRVIHGPYKARVSCSILSSVSQVDKTQTSMAGSSLQRIREGFSQKWTKKGPVESHATHGPVRVPWSCPTVG